MKKLKSFALSCLTLSLCVSLFACTTTTTDGKTTSVADSNSNAKWTNITKASDIQLENKKFVFMGINGDEDWIQKQITAFKALGGEPEFIPTIWEQRMQQLANKVTTDDSPDMFNSEPSAGEWPALITAGLAMQIDDLIDYSSPLFAPFKEYADDLKIDGKMYAMPYGKGVLASFLYYNKKVFEDNGIPTPYELYAQNDWTIDKMHEIAKELTVEKDGELQNIGLYCVDESPFIAATGRDIIETDENGKLINNIKDPFISKAFEKIQKMAVEDRCMTMDKTIARDMMLNGQIAMWAGGSWESDNFKILLQKGDIEFVPFPRDTQADDWYLSGAVYVNYIPMGAKNPDAAVSWIATNIELGNDQTFNDTCNNEFVDSRNMPKSFISVYTDMNDVEKMKLNVLQYGLFPEFTEEYIAAFWQDFYSDKVPWATVAEKLSPKLDETLAKINARS